MVKELVLLPYQGMWMSTALLFPLGIFFTYKATTDSTLFDLTGLVELIKNIFKKKEAQ